MYTFVNNKVHSEHSAENALKDFHQRSNFFFRNFHKYLSILNIFQDFVRCCEWLQQTNYKHSIWGKFRILIRNSQILGNSLVYAEQCTNVFTSLAPKFILKAFTIIYHLYTFIYIMQRFSVTICSLQSLDMCYVK